MRARTAIGRRTFLHAAAVAGALGTVGLRVPRARARTTRSEGNTMRKGMLGFMLGHEQFPVPELVELGVRAERAGFDLLATSDHFQPWQANEGHCGHAWVTLAALGQRTEHVWLGTTVTCPTLRYAPADVAEAFASLAALCPGRVFLGVGSGEALNEQAATGRWPKWSERSARLVEATDVIRELWTGREVRHRGKYYEVAGKLYDPPPRPIPLLMAGNNGPQALRRCGRHADGLITDPKSWKQHRGDFEAGARAAGKDPATMPVLVEAFVVVGTDADARSAATLWRFLPKAFESYFEIRDPAEIERRANAEVPIEQVIGSWIVGTDPELHARRIVELMDGGATIVNVHSGQPDQRRVIDFYGKEVVPRVRKVRPAA
jgi:TAT-translocated FGD2 family F420-dependent dehydrogenase